MTAIRLAAAWAVLLLLQDGGVRIEAQPSSDQGIQQRRAPLQKTPPSDITAAPEGAGGGRQRPALEATATPWAGQIASTAQSGRQQASGLRSTGKADGDVVHASAPPGGAASGSAATGLSGLPPAQNNRDSTDSPQGKARSGWVALPLVSYAPETHLGLGGFCVHFFRFGASPVTSRASSLAVVALQTTRKQFIGELIPELYWDEDAWHLWSKADYRRYPNSLWEVGDDAADETEERYLENSIRWQIWLRRLVFLSAYLEGRLDLQYVTVGQAKRGGLLDMGGLPGSQGGRTMGAGVTVGWDTRDHALRPHQGAWYELSLMSWQRFWMSEYDFWRVKVNLRQYVPIIHGHTLALQAYGEFLGGEVPFYKMATLGGEFLLRGYFDGRYRDHNLMAFQAEYRMPIFWRFGLAPFVGIGDVADKLSNFDFGDLKWTVGGGLRIELNEQERLPLRLDAGVGPGTFAFYLGIKEAF